METAAYDKVSAEIKSILDNQNYYQVSKLLNEWLRECNLLAINEGSPGNFKYADKIEKLKALKEEEEKKITAKLKNVLEAYFSTLEKDETLHHTNMPKSIFARLKDAKMKDVYIHRDNSTKEITFSNFDTEIDDNFYEELEYAADGFEEDPAKVSVADFFEKVNNLIDNWKSVPYPVAEVSTIGFDPKTNFLHFKIIPPEFDGNSAIEKYRVLVFRSENNNTEPHKELETSNGYFYLEKLDPNHLYYFTAQPFNSIGYQELCVKFYLRAVQQKSPIKQVIMLTSNEFEQLPVNPAFSHEKLSEDIYSLKMNEENSAGRLLDLDSGYSSVAVLENGELLEWGLITRFENDDYNDKNLPIEKQEDVKEGITDVYAPLDNIPVVSVNCGLSFCVVLSNMGDLYSWGDNRRGQLGLGDCAGRVLPTKIKGLPFIKSVQVSNKNCIALDMDEKVYVWGKHQGLFGIHGSNEGPMIVPGYNNQFTPRFINETLGDIKDIRCGKEFNVILTKRGRLLVSGSNKFGQLGFDKPNGLELPFCDWPHCLYESAVEEVRVAPGHTVVKIQKNGQVEFWGFGENTASQIVEQAAVKCVRAPSKFPLKPKAVKQFWAFGKCTAFLYDDGERHVFGNNYGLAQYLEESTIVKNPYRNSIVLLK